jgi:F-type H+-transporting ATPase subunit gamma
MMSVKQIRRKIRAVNNIKKITRAMEMVSASKLKKVQERLIAIRPYAGKIRELLERLCLQVQGLDYPLLKPRPKVRTIALVVFTSDKGLCGSYNSNMLRATAEFLRKRDLPAKLVVIGRKAVEFYKKSTHQVKASHVQMPTAPTFAEVKPIITQLVEMFESGEVDEVHVAYTEFVNAIVYKQRILKFLPVEPTNLVETHEGLSGDTLDGRMPEYDKPSGLEPQFPYGYIFEPEPKLTLGKLIPRYIEVAFHRLLTYNKARQSGITGELLDIVGGAEALG